MSNPAHRSTGAVAARVAMAAVLLATASRASAASYDCVIDPSMTVDLASATGGIVEEVAVREGDLVAAGDLVARLSSDVEQATVRVLEVEAFDASSIEAEAARLRFLENRLERVQSLLDRGVATQEQLEEAQSEVETSRSMLARTRVAQAQAQAELARAQAALERMALHSPIDGLVTEVALSQGEYLHPENRVVRIVRLDPLHVEAFLPVATFGSVSRGDVGVVHPAAPVGGAHPAEITLIDQVFDAASGTYRIRLRLPNPDVALPAGHRCDLTLPDAMASEPGAAGTAGRMD